MVADANASEKAKAEKKIVRDRLIGEGREREEGYGRATWRFRWLPRSRTSSYCSARKVLWGQPVFELTSPHHKSLSRLDQTQHLYDRLGPVRDGQGNVPGRLPANLPV